MVRSGTSSRAGREYAMRESSARTMRWVRWLYGQLKSGHFPRAVWRSVTVPSRIGDDELLARYCDKQAVKSEIKYSVFVRTKLPLEISVDRVRYCNPSERAKHEAVERRKPRTFL